jgi:hypothetical protein
MHCYQTLAATTLAARIIDELRGPHHYLPTAALADWMETNGIAIEDVLDADRETLRAQLAALLDREARSQLSRAA